MSSGSDFEDADFGVKDDDLDFDLEDLKEEEAFKPAPRSRRPAASKPTTPSTSTSGPRPPAIKYAGLKFKLNTDKEPAYVIRKADRELDSDIEEPLILEEQFILRLPTEGELQKKVKDMVATRELGTRKGAAKHDGEPFFRFRDSRRGVFGFGKPDKPDKAQLYHAKFVDMPSIIESHKTQDAGRHMYKVADITQMLVVEGQIPPGQDPAFFDKEFNLDDFIWPHGLTPPMKHCRKRRYRKRANKRVRLLFSSMGLIGTNVSAQTIEQVERVIEELLTKDGRAKKVTYGALTSSHLSIQILTVWPYRIDRPERGLPGPERGTFHARFHARRFCRTQSSCRHARSRDASRFRHWHARR